jgi:hypothetical protein
MTSDQEKIDSEALDTQDRRSSGSLRNYVSISTGLVDALCSHVAKSALGAAT